MKASTISAAVALIVAQVYGAPSANKVEARDPFIVSITFRGAGGASFSQGFPADNSQVAITNPLSATSISSVGGGFCFFTGVDGSVTAVTDADIEHPVSTPQPQVSGSCQNL